KGYAYPYVNFSPGALMKVAPTQEVFVPSGSDISYITDESNTEAYPWRCFGLLRTTFFKKSGNKQKYMSSGVLIGRRLVMTSARSFTSENHVRIQIEFFPGHNRGYSPWKVTSSRFLVPEQYDELSGSKRSQKDSI